MLANIAAKARTLTYVEFTQIYEDDSVLNVSNSSQVSAYPRMKDKLSLRYPDKRAPAELYQAFVRLKQALKNSANPLRFDKAKGLQYLEDHIARESDSLVIKNYCYKAVDADGNRSLTWKGAFLLTWKSLFPGRLMQQYRDKYYADKLLRKALP